MEHFQDFFKNTNESYTCRFARHDKQPKVNYLKRKRIIDFPHKKQGNQIQILKETAVAIDIFIQRVHDLFNSPCHHHPHSVNNAKKDDDRKKQNFESLICNMISLLLAPPAVLIDKDTTISSARYAYMIRCYHILKNHTKVYIPDNVNIIITMYIEQNNYLDACVRSAYLED